MSEPLDFLTAGDAGVGWGLAGVVGSILRAVPAPVRLRITLIDGGLPERLKGELQEAVRQRSRAELRFVPFTWPDDCQAPPLEGSRLAYARLFAARVIDGETCLYLDADTVLREDPSPLFAEARRHPEVPLWAARNYPDDNYHKQLGRQSAELVRDLPLDTPYFNSGLLVMNLGAWSETAEQCLALAAKHQFIAHDQDALNVHFQGRWKELPERWNFQLYERYEIPPTAALLHYSGRNKPWHFGYPAAARQPFVDALETVGWRDWKPALSLKQWLRNSPLRPLLSQAQYWARRSAGMAAVKRR